MSNMLCYKVSNINFLGTMHHYMAFADVILYYRHHYSGSPFELNDLFHLSRFAPLLSSQRFITVLTIYRQNI